MSCDYSDCDYPCSICDPEEWAEENKPPAYNFTMKYEYALLKLDALLHSIEAAQVRPRVPIWWELWSPWPDNWKVERKIQTEDISPYMSSMPTTTMVMQDQIYIVDTYSQRRWPIIKYGQRVVDWDKKLVAFDGIYASQPPEFGVWMPSLRNL